MDCEREPRRRRAPLVLAVAGALFLTGAAGGARGADAPREGRETAREIALRLDARLATLRTMKGRFVQSFASSGLGMPQSEGGRFFLKRPDLMRWDYTTPEVKTAVSDGAHTWLYVPEDAVVYRGSVAAFKSRGAFAALASGSLRSEFEAIGVEARGAQVRGDVVLTLKPLSERDDLASLLIEIEPTRLSIASMTAIDGAGNRIAILFSDVEEDVDLPGDLFTFAPPDGARVIDQDPRPANR
ncbi:MAG: outer membrane lipoprotein carrier protein LolA [Acidobacteria bacterium]|nr:outer membrane lipoprotein carrier protein LolA [Acidobacteriota bacterium]